MADSITRRDLGKAAIAGAALAAAGSEASAAGGLEMRPYGKTGMLVSVLGIGTSPFGAANNDQKTVNDVLSAALDEGINYLDTAPIYGQSERRLGVGLKGRRDKFILVSKVEATSKQDATWLVQESLQKLQTDYLDVVHLHNVGRTDRFPDLEVLLGPDGALQALRDLKKKGVVRHIGMTCHLRPKRALPVIATGEIEAVMCAANFVDVHNYNFEGTVFSEAAKRGMAVVAMKILGGASGDGALLSGLDHYDLAVRYALGIPGLSVAIMGMKNVPELRKAVQTVRAYEKFNERERMQVTQLGRQMARDWGEHRGPVEWKVRI
jgi:predicted aldo/keto reductase-like oxidoreductase